MSNYIECKQLTNFKMYPEEFQTNQLEKRIPELLNDLIVFAAGAVELEPSEFRNLHIEKVNMVYHGDREYLLIFQHTDEACEEIVVYHIVYPN